MRLATELNPSFLDAFYYHAVFCALLTDSGSAIPTLEYAIKGDSRYYERAQSDPAFDGIRADVRALFERLSEQERPRVDQALREQQAWVDEREVIGPQTALELSISQNRINDALSTADSYPQLLAAHRVIVDAQERLAVFDKAFELNAISEIATPFAKFHPAGHVIACASNEILKVLEFPSGILVRTLSGHKDLVYSADFDPTGSLLASTSLDGTVKVWDFNTGSLVRTLRCDGTKALAATFNYDSTIIATSDNACQIKLWDVASGKDVKTLTGHAQPSLALAFARFGNEEIGSILASGSNDKTIRLWFETKNWHGKILRGHGASVRSISFSSNNRMLSGGDEDNTAILWNFQKCAEFARLEAHSARVFDVSLNPTGEVCAIASGDKTATLWDLRDRPKLIRKIQFSSPCLASTVCPTHPGILACVAGGRLWCRMPGFQSKEDSSDVAHYSDSAVNNMSLSRELRQKAYRRMGRCEVCGGDIGFMDKMGGASCCRTHR